MINRMNQINIAIFQIDKLSYFSGASETAYFLYPSTKGRTENYITSLSFDRTTIYRPGVLIVPEGRDEIRAIEWILQRFLSVFDFGPYFSISTTSLAKTMVKYALNDLAAAEGERDELNKLVRILENKEISDYALQFYNRKL